MVQAKTSDFQPLPLKILNVLSLLAGASLLVAVSWEILLGDPRHYSTDYLLLQGDRLCCFSGRFLCPDVDG